MAVSGVVKPTVAGTSASPNLGNGGANYNTAEAELKKKIAQNQLNIATNKGHVQDETARALQVIKERQAAGKDTSDQQKYLNTNLGYKAPTPNANTNVAPSTTFSGNGVGSASQIKSNTSQSSELMDLMRSYATRPQSEFNYDLNSDPSYKAALQRASSNIDVGNSQAQAEMNRRRILNSTITSDRMGEIASKEMRNVETTIVPQLMAQAYQKYQDQQNQEQQQFSNMGSLSQMYIGEDQRGIDNTNTRAGLTGYLSGGEEAQGLVNQLMMLKQQAETQGITAAERTKLSNQADGIRGLLSQMGVDASAYGSNVNYNTASQVTPNIRTLAGQQLDASKQAQTFNQGQQSWENNFATEQQAYKAARDAISDGQWKSQFDQSVNQFGLNYALDKLQESNQTAYQQAQLALSQSDDARMWVQQEQDMINAGGTGKYSGMTTAQVLDSARQMFTVKNAQTGTETFPTDATSQDKIYNYVGSLGLPVGQDDQVMLSLGLTPETIKSLDKKYGVSLGN